MFCLRWLCKICSWMKPGMVFFATALQSKTRGSCSKITIQQQLKARGAIRYYITITWCISNNWETGARKYYTIFLSLKQLWFSCSFIDNLLQIATTHSQSIIVTHKIIITFILFSFHLFLYLCSQIKKKYAPYFYFAVMQRSVTAGHIYYVLLVMVRLTLTQ